MSATLSQIRDGLATNLSVAFGSSWNVYARMAGNANLPAIDIRPGPVEYDKAMRSGAHDLTILIRAMVPATSDLSMQHNLDQLVDPDSATSLKAAVEADKTLAGTVAFARVSAATDYRLWSAGPGTPESLGVEFTVLVTT